MGTARTQIPVPLKYDYRDLVDTPQSFSGVEIIDAGITAIYLPNEVAFFEANFTLNTQADGLGTNITGFTFERLDDILTNQWALNVYQQITVTDPTYQTGAIYAFGDIAGAIVDALDINRLQDQITDLTPSADGNFAVGDTFYTFNPSGRNGMIRFDFDNVVKKTSYQDLYDVIGDSFNQQHIDAGDASPAGDEFYPTPIPGAFSRSALPDARITTSEVSTGTNTVDLAGYSAEGKFRNGTPFYFTTDGTLPSGLTEGTVYYLYNNSGTLYTMHANEADGIAGTSPISLTTVGSGIFILTQRGIYLGDSIANHKHLGASIYNDGISVDDTSNGTVTESGSGDAIARDTSVANRHRTYSADNLNSSNETRPETIMQYGFIIYSNLAIAPPTTAAKYDTGWILFDTGWLNKSTNINHGLDAPITELITKIYITPDGTDDSAIEIRSASSKNPGNAANVYGNSLLAVDDNNIEYRTGTNGIQYIDNAGAQIILDSETTYSLRAVIYKPETIAETTTALKYDTGYISNSSWVNQLFSVSHGLNAELSEVIWKFIVSTDGTDAGIISSHDYSMDTRGLTAYPLTANSFEIQTGNAGLLYLAKGTGNSTAITAQSWWYRIIVYKPNSLANILDNPVRQVTTINDGVDVTANLPDATNEVQERTYFRKGNGAGKLVFTTENSQTVGGELPGFWSLGGHQDNSVITLLPVSGNWEVKKFYDGIYFVEDQKTDGTAGGTSTGGARNSRDLNTESQTHACGSLSANRVTLDPGNYDVWSAAPVYIPNRTKLYLVSDPAGTPFDELSSMNNYSSLSAGVVTVPVLIGTVRITSSTIFELQQWIQTGKATEGLGITSNEAGIVEKYSQLKFIRRIDP